MNAAFMSSVLAASCDNFTADIHMPLLGDALGAAVGVRALPAPHAALNGAPDALPIVHRLMAERVEAM